MVAAHLSATGRLGELVSLCLGVAVLDHCPPAGSGGRPPGPCPAGGLGCCPPGPCPAGGSGGRPPGAAERGYRRGDHRRGHGRRRDGGIGRARLPGRASPGRGVGWLRPDDLIWNYRVNDTLEGRPPPAFDILYWNADTTRLPAALHRDFVALALANALTKPGEATMLGSPVDLSKVDVDAYVIAGTADHICPWQSCYRTTQLLGGQVTFALSTSGHRAATATPRATKSAPTAPANPADPREFLAAARKVPGSRRPDYSSWLAGRSRGRKRNPASSAARATQ